MHMPTLIGKIEPGDVVGRCRIIRELGRGGVGTVYLATHQTLQIEVALKILSPSLSLDNPALAERFIREAQLAARIRHPNVIAVMDAAHDETTGLYFIVLEYVGGGSLSWHLRHGPLPEAKALSIIIDITHALILAEESSVVHRDIKPDNIMLDLRGTAKLADLGLAKHAIDSRTSLTLGGSFMGTPAYMSPEQARDAKVADTRDDIYSLGATLYECLTGEAPFQGETPYNIMSELLTKPSPKPRDHRPEISRSVDLICRKMMAKTRDLRYADARALLRDLQHCQMFGDGGIEKLEAATFDHDSIVATQQARSYGVETSADGVALLSEYANPEANPTVGLAPASSIPPRPDRGVFRAAALLVTLVTLAVLLLVWLGSQHAPSTENQTVASAPNPIATQPAQPAPSNPPSAPENPTQNLTGIKNEKPPVDPAPIIPNNLAIVNPVLPPVVAPSQEEIPSATTNAGLASPTNSVDALSATPAVSAAPDSAFTARTIADPTGQEQLLKIVGKRDKSELTPTTWTFYFYDKNVSSTNARVVTVAGGKVVKSGPLIVDTTHPLPWLFSSDEKEILPADKLLTDSTQALAKAEELLKPDVIVSSAEFELTAKDSFPVTPVWKVTLWAKNKDGEGKEIGTVEILAKENVVSENHLKSEWVAQ